MAFPSPNPPARNRQSRRSPAFTIALEGGPARSLLGNEPALRCATAVEEFSTPAEAHAQANHSLARLRLCRGFLWLRRTWANHAGMGFDDSDAFRE